MSDNRVVCKPDVNTVTVEILGIVFIHLFISVTINDKTNTLTGVPVDTRRENDVKTTSRRRFDVTMTLLLRRVPVEVGGVYDGVSAALTARVGHGHWVGVKRNKIVLQPHERIYT